MIPMVVSHDLVKELIGNFNSVNEQSKTVRGRKKNEEADAVCVKLLYHILLSVRLCYNYSTYPLYVGVYLCVCAPFYIYVCALY